MSKRESWDRTCDETLAGLLRPATEALSTVAGDLPGWRYAALRAIVVDLAEEAAFARTQLALGSQPPLAVSK